MDDSGFFLFLLWFHLLLLPLWLVFVCVETDNSRGTDVFTYFFICTVFFLQKGMCVRPAGGKKLCLCVCFHSVSLVPLPGYF